MGRVQGTAASRMVGGSATPAARRARVAAGRGAERMMKCFAVVLDLGFRQRIQIGDDLRPGAHALEQGNPLFQPRFQHQREEAAEH